MRKRSRSREFALQILYSMDISDASLTEALEDFWTDKKESVPGDSEKVIDVDKKDPEIRRYTEKIIRGAIDKLEPIDTAVEKYAENWSMKRMACVDRNILRLATYEIMFCDDIPIKVAINEAVEIAKRYGEADSSKFVNGILDRIAKSECPQKK